MVSGTPLHGGVDDLNGELDFLGVWPFCLSDQTDGFWAHRIGTPFANRDAECLPLLRALLRGAVVRHTKAQRRVADGSPLLTLPAAARELRAVRHGAAAHEAPSERFVCSFLEHHASVAARGALRVLLDEESRVGAGSSARSRSARQLATRLLRLVRGATTSATLVRARLREVEEAMRFASTSHGARRSGGHATHGSAVAAPFRDAAGQLDASAVDAAAAEDVRRVRALPAGLALLELMAPREANASGPTSMGSRGSLPRGTAADNGGRAASAFALRNADMRSFEADRHAWRGTSREYADARGADLAHKLADVADGVFKILRNAAERHRRGDADAAARADAVPGVAALLAETAARREAARARLHRLQHAFPGRLTALCACAGWTCGCGKTHKARPLTDATDETEATRGWTISCCASAATFAELARADNRAARAREAAEVASAADAAARDAVAAARAPLPKLRWLLAVELITSGAAFERFGAAARAESRGAHSEPERDGSRGRLSFRFLRRAFLAARLDGLVASADAALERARAAAQDRDPADPSGKPRRAIARAPAAAREAYRVAVAAARDARARRREETPGGVRLGARGEGFVTTDRGRDRSLLEWVVPRLRLDEGANGRETPSTLAPRAALDALYEAVDRARARSARLAEEIGALAPYMRALASAGASTDFTIDVGSVGSDVGSVTQGGFALIDEIALGKTTPQCCICCAPARAPTITRCMHLACARCVVTWFHAAPMHGAAAAAGGAPCPLCRKPFQIEDLIRLVPNEEAGGGDAARRGDGDDARAEKDARKPREDGREETATPEAPRFSSAPTPASFARLPLPPGEDPGDHRDGRYPALSMDGGRFLAHVRRACARRSPKMAALVADLREAFKRPGASGKAVVFSQLRDALVCAAEALTWEGLGPALVDGAASRGAPNAAGSREAVRPEDAAARAVARFREDPECRVLLLHAGSAAAGLTLTHADLVILLEPFLSPGDEAQAANRVHRIGQTRAVRCVTYFVRGTVEERLLAFRTRQAAFGGGGDGAGDGMDAADGAEDAAETSAAALGVIRDAGDAFAANMSRAQFDRMRFIFGLSDRAGLSGGAGETDDAREERETT